MHTASTGSPIRFPGNLGPLRSEEITVRGYGLRAAIARVTGEEVRVHELPEPRLATAAGPGWLVDDPGITVLVDVDALTIEVKHDAADLTPDAARALHAALVAAVRYVNGVARDTDVFLTSLHLRVEETARAVTAFRETSDGPSGDEEHEAALELANAAESLVDLIKRAISALPPLGDTFARRFRTEVGKGTVLAPVEVAK